MAELEVGLAVGAARQPFGLHARLEGADLTELAVVEAALGPAQRCDERRGIARPARRPPRPGSPAAAPGPPTRATTGRSTRRYDASDRTSGPLLPSGRSDASTSRLGSGPRSPSRRISSLTTSSGLRLGLRVVGALDRVVHEDHVGVAAVALLATPEPPHPDDEQAGERRCARALLEVAQAHLEGDLEQRGGEVGHRRPEVVEGQRAGQVGDRHAEQLGAADRAGGEHRGPGVVLAAGGRPHPAQHVLAGAGLQPRRSRRGTARTPGACSSRSAAKRLRARVWASRSAAEPSSRSSRRYQCVEPSSSLILRKASSPASGSASSANQPSITGSSWRWIGGPPAQPAGERLEVPQRASGVAETQRGQPFPRRLGRQAHLGVGQPRHGGQQGAVEDPLVQPAHLALLGAPLRDDGLGG